MVGNFDSERIQLERTWELTRLIADLERIKASNLSSFEAKCLYGFLCRYNLSLIASKLGWSLNALRTELSRGLYAYIKDLLCRDRIIWSRISDWLAPQYAKHIAILQPSVAASEQLPDKYRASQIVALVLAKQAAASGRARVHSTAEDSEIIALKDYGDLRLRSGKPIEAIKIYLEVMERDLSFLGLLNKIAACFYKLELYNDVGEVCNFLLCHTRTDNVKLVSYNFLGLISRQSALRDYNDLHVDRAIYYFTQARELSKFDVLPAWNIIEILLNFVSERHYYLQRATLLMPEFIELAANPESNFIKYQNKISAEAKIVFPQNEWWQNIYVRLERLGK
jgi:hypothetical protein